MGLQSFATIHALGVLTRFTNADGTAFKDIVPAQDNDVLIANVILANSDTIPHVIDVEVFDGVTHTRITSYSTAAGRGYASVGTLDMLASAAVAWPNGYLLPRGFSMRAAMEIAVVATFEFTFNVVAGTL